MDEDGPVGKGRVGGRRPFPSGRTTRAPTSSAGEESHGAARVGGPDGEGSVQFLAGEGDVVRQHQDRIGAPGDRGGPPASAAGTLPRRRSVSVRRRDARLGVVVGTIAAVLLLLDANISHRGAELQCFRGSAQEVGPTGFGDQSHVELVATGPGSCNHRRRRRSGEGVSDFTENGQSFLLQRFAQTPRSVLAQGTVPPQGHAEVSAESRSVGPGRREAPASYYCASSAPPDSVHGQRVGLGQDEGGERRREEEAEEGAGRHDEGGGQEGRQR
mmetsp:Transcript_14065/g.26541  ORF Transcript_14065/g.26541 Transcript_14065/m.26541 type:complete len:272 (+) Transcript_14065:2571-3386(+)